MGGIAWLELGKWNSVFGTGGWESMVGNGWVELGGSGWVAIGGWNRVGGFWMVELDLDGGSLVGGTGCWRSVGGTGCV